MDIDLKMLFNYPLISEKTVKDYKIYSGIVRIQNSDVNVFIQQKGEPSNPVFHCDIESESVANIVNKRIADEGPKNILTCLDILSNYMSSVIKKPQDFTDAYTKVLQEYNEFSNFFLTLKHCELSHDLTVIHVQMTDDKNRIHSSEISINLNDAQRMFYFTHCDLPLTKPFAPNSSLLELFDQYISVVESLQTYFDLMDTLDQSAHILDPEEPKRADAFRRIWLEENLSIIITVQPFDIFIRPDIKFLGPDRLVDNYRSKLNTNLHLWKDGNIFDNILTILDIQSFPQKEHCASNSFILKNTEDCAICFSSRCNEKLPDVICKNPCCEIFYHGDCLYQWLVATNGNRVFNEIYGQCPNCETSIMCKIPVI